MCGMGPGGNNNGPASDDGGALDPDSLAQSGVHYDTRTTQAGDGTRFGGVVDAMFAVDTYVHLVWASAATSTHYFYKNGVQVAARPAPPVGVDLHDSYRIGSVGGGGGEFVGVIDEVGFYDFTLTDDETKIFIQQIKDKLNDVLSQKDCFLQTKGDIDTDEFEFAWRDAVASPNITSINIRREKDIFIDLFDDENEGFTGILRWGKGCGFTNIRFDVR